MIEDDDTIRFHSDDVPWLPELHTPEMEAEREAERLRKEATIRWLEENNDWYPIGDVW